MNITPQARGKRLERETLKALEKTGWRVTRQPSSGAFGARVGAQGLTGDLRIKAGEFAYRVECKRRRKPPLTLMGWLSGCDFLVIQADGGEATVFTTLARFQEVLSAAAEHLSAPPDTTSKHRQAKEPRAATRSIGRKVPKAAVSRWKK